MIKKTFRGEIFFYFIIVFVIFTVAILTFQYQREKKYRISQLENTLDNIAEITYRFVEENKLIPGKQVDKVSELVRILPNPNTRITLIANEGQVWYDNYVEEYRSMENHLSRPEMQQALKNGSGSNIRLSTTTNQEFYYYAKYYDHYFIRVSLVYNVEVKNFLKTSRLFIIFIIISFLIVGALLVLVTLRMSDAITTLKDFSIKAGKNEPVDYDTSFPENELGTIGKQIIQIYNSLRKTKDDLINEKEKLFNHLDALDEGVAFFSPEKKKILSNSRFIQFVNLFSKKAVISDEKMLKLSEFKKLNEFLRPYIKGEKEITVEPLPQIEYTISKNEKYFKIQGIVFFDKSFEIVMTDVTRLEKRRLMKQQLTSNIAHELKTPLASIKGYLETILQNWPIPEEKQKYFLGKAYFQSERLTDLINDVSLINNIEDAGDLFEFKPVDISKIVKEVYENFANRIEENKIDFQEQIEEETIIQGNESLLFSIFQNFVENSINYGGKEISIAIKCYHQDEKYYYFSYSDTGVGIDEEHLPRIFERFYRVDHGRSREKGGTGLGLAIVKNAIQLHKGRISVKRKSSGGVEFLFSLSKK